MFDLENFDLEQLRSYGDDDSHSMKSNKTEAERPQLGLFIEDKTEGIVVTEVIDGSVADKAGIKEDDLITHIDDNVIGSFRELSAWMNTKSIGDDAVITVNRKGKSKDLKVKL